MKILLTSNKTIRRGNKFVEDTGYQNVFLPLQELGHDVHYYDTVRGSDTSYKKIIEKFKPDLIFCCFTGDLNITPFEPWEEVYEETLSGRTKTFNWFCDDTWRFDKFSSNVCHYFNVCSTPEPTYLKKFKQNGYSNIIVGMWHSNLSFYPVIPFKEKTINLSFVGRVDMSRMYYLSFLAQNGTIPEVLQGASSSEMLNFMANSKIALNFSVNPNDPEKKTQMKGRMFEIPATNSLMVTEYHSGIEEFYKIDKEIITFKTREELLEKVRFLLKKEDIVERIASNGFQRFKKEHDSKVRLKKLLEEIKRV